MAFVSAAAAARGITFLDLLDEAPDKAALWLERLSAAGNLDERTRSHLALGLGQLGFPSSLSALRSLKEDPSTAVRGAAGAAITLIDKAPAATHSYAARGAILAAVGKEKRRQLAQGTFEAFLELLAAAHAWQVKEDREERRRLAHGTFEAFLELLAAAHAWQIGEDREAQRQQAQLCFDTLLDLLAAGYEWQIRNDFNELLEIAAAEDWGSMVLRGEALLAKAGPDWRDRDLFRFTGTTCFTAMAYNVLLKDGRLDEPAFDRMLALSHASKDAGAELSRSVQDRQADLLQLKAYM